MMKIVDNSEWNQRDKAAVTKGEDNRGENIKSGFFVFGVERKVRIGTNIVWISIHSMLQH